VEYDLVIRDGSVVDGTGRPPFRGDVAVAGDRIAAVAATGDLDGDGSELAGSLLRSGPPSG
jgi:N-acyl-D-amino-acid deacylase